MKDKSTNKDDNPLGMRPLEDTGPFVLPPTACSQRRLEFFRRGNTILGFYTVTAIVSKTGQEVISNQEKQGKFKLDTAFRLKMDDGNTAQMNYGLFKKYFTKAGAHLTNQVFLMLYGNFEAYLCDLILDALTQMKESDPYEETLRLMSTSKWRGKMDRVTQKLNVPLGTRVFMNQFKDIDMRFLGQQCNNPIEFLEKVADLRHRLVHYSGKVDKEFSKAYPNTGLSEGATISLPFGLPMSLQLFFAHLTDVIDKAFSLQYGWQRTVVPIEKLTEG